MTRFIFIVVVLLGFAPLLLAADTAAVFKIRGKLSYERREPDSNKLSPKDSTEVLIITDGVKWKISTAVWKYSAPAEMFFDGTDTFYYLVARDFLPSHKLPGDEKIAYTCSILPGDIFPRRFSTERLLGSVFLSRNVRKPDLTLPPINPKDDAPPTRAFTSTGDRLNAVLKPPSRLLLSKSVSPNPSTIRLLQSSSSRKQNKSVMSQSRKRSCGSSLRRSRWVRQPT